jgi:MCP family monocarboxylic acid transporter-like MFS transporter 13/MCP family monocarboxylic acid transporter-like MFS transporter 12
MTLLTLGSGPLAARLVARLGHRATSLLGVALAASGLTTAGAYIQAGGASLWALHGAVGGMTGLGFGLMYLPAVDIVAHYFSSRLGLAAGLAAAGSGAGQLVLAPLLHLGTAKLGLAATLHCLAGLVATAAAFSLLYRAPGEESYRGISPGQSRRASAAGEVVEQEAKSSCCPQPSILLLLLSHFLFSIGVFSSFTFSTDRAVVRGLSPAQASFLLSLMGVCNCLGRVGFGLLLDRFRAQAIRLTAAAMLLNAASVAGSEYLPGLPGQAAFAAVFGLTFGCYVSSVVVVLQRVTPTITAPLGLVLLTAGLASLAGPLAVGGLYDLTGSYTIGFLLAGGLAAGGAILPLGLRTEAGTQYLPHQEEKDQHRI